MNFPADQVAELKALSAEVSYAEEGGVGYFLFSGLKLPAGYALEVSDALLCPTVLDGYNSRLFFTQIVQPKSRALNWNRSARILDRQWHAFSWQTQPRDRRLAQLVAEHLSALR